jgi:hypothetical protein
MLAIHLLHGKGKTMSDYIDYDWTGSYQAAFSHGIGHGLTTADAMKHADEIMQGYREPTDAEVMAYERVGLSFLTGITVVDHDVDHVEVYTLDSGRLAYVERWEAADVGSRGIREGFITNATTCLWGDV